ncbi:MAG: sugar phosphate isomerase/epimerase family protein [Planctomycetota bacterium]|jgi:hexulose-6-phosphate isomerase
MVDEQIQAFPWEHWQREFALAAEHDFPTIEWTLDQARLHENPLMTPGGRAEIGNLSAEHRACVNSLTGDCFMQAPFYKAGGAARQGLLDDLRAVLEACRYLEIHHVVIPLVDAGSIARREEADSLREGLERVRDLLAPEALSIAFESDLPPTALAEFIASYPEGEFGINYDSGNSAGLGFDPAEEIGAYAARILNVHVKDRVLGGTTVPLGEGAADLPRVLQLLTEAGYAGDFILQTARAAAGRDVEVLCGYRDAVRGWLEGASA